MNNFWNGFEKYAGELNRKWYSQKNEEFMKAMGKRNKLKPLHVGTKALLASAALGTGAYAYKKLTEKKASNFEDIFNAKTKKSNKPQWGVTLDMSGDEGDRAQGGDGMFSTSPSAGSDVYTGGS